LKTELGRSTIAWRNRNGPGEKIGCPFEEQEKAVIVLIDMFILCRAFRPRCLRAAIYFVAASAGIAVYLDLDQTD